MGNAGYGFAEITLQRDMHTVRATVGNVFITYTREKKPDPFVILVVDDIQQQTTHRDNTKQAFFGETFVLPCHPGSIMDVYVADKDWLKDYLMFNGSIPLDEIPLGRTVTVHVRREPGISTNDYTIHEESTPELPLFIPPNQYAEHTPLFTEPLIVREEPEPIFVHEEPEPITVIEEAPTTVIHRTGPAVSRVTTRVTTIVHPPRVIEERHHVLPCAVY